MVRGETECGTRPHVRPLLSTPRSHGLVPGSFTSDVNFEWKAWNDTGVAIMGERARLHPGSDRDKPLPGRAPTWIAQGAWRKNLVHSS